MSKKIISTENAPAAIGPYSQAVMHNDMLFCSGQIPVNPQTKEIPNDVVDQARQAMKNLGAVLEEAGMNYGNILKTTIFLTDMADFATVNQIYAEYFTGDFPARATVQVAGLPLGVQVEIEAVAAL